MPLGHQLIRSLFSFVVRGAKIHSVRHEPADEFASAWACEPGQVRIALPEAIEIVETSLSGVAVEACASVEAGKVSYRIEVVRDYTPYAVCVDARTGAVSEALDVGLLDGERASGGTIGRLLLSRLEAGREHF